MRRTTSQLQSTEGSFVGLARLNTGATDQWIVKGKFKIPPAFCKNKISQRNRSRGEGPITFQSLRKRASTSDHPFTTASLTCTQNFNTISLETLDLSGALDRWVSLPSADAPLMVGGGQMLKLPPVTTADATGKGSPGLQQMKSQVSCWIYHHHLSLTGRISMRSSLRVKWACMEDEETAIWELNAISFLQNPEPSAIHGEWFIGVMTMSETLCFVI